MDCNLVLIRQSNHARFPILNFSSVPAILVLFGTLYYAVVQTGLIIGLFRLKRPNSKQRPLVSIIVAARNEERSLGALLESLLHQTYTNYEIIVVDDRSTDATSEIIRSAQKSDARLKLVMVRSKAVDMPPKKHALTEGIRASKGPILCFTDADCLPERTWIESLVSFFDEGVGVVAGYSPYDVKLLSEGVSNRMGMRLLHAFVKGEEFKGAIWSAGSIGMNLAWLCTGRNLAYRRSVFDEVGGFEQIKMSVSGDDDLFLQLIRRSTHWTIQYATSPESFVRTAPPESFAEFIQQRTRHFSAGKYFTYPMKAFFSLFHFSNLILFLGLLSVFFSYPLFQIAAIGFAVKLTFDLVLTISAIRIVLRTSVRRGLHLTDFLLTEILYIFYNTFVGPLGFINTFKWKQD